MRLIDRVVREEAQRFIDGALRQFDCHTLDSLPALPDTAQPLLPTHIQDIRSIAPHERQRLRADFYSPRGVAYFVCETDARALNPHPLLILAEQVAAELPMRYPIPHPLENHARITDMFGEPDGTVKIYNVSKESGGYREQGETADAFRLHHDGLGSGGAVEVAALYMDAPPFWGGFTYFFNVSRCALEIARTDYEAFVALFLPNALAITRPRGKGAIRVTSPVLYLNEADAPQSSFRLASGEYTVELLPGVPELERAVRELATRMAPFAPGCMFVSFAGRGHGCLIRNPEIAHGRTAFGDSRSHRRVLARKWYGRQESDIVYKHVPAVRVSDRLASAYPDLFAPERLTGEWRLNSSGENVRAM